LLLLEQVGDDIAASAQADLIAFNLSDETARKVMVMIGVRETAVGPDQFDPVFLDTIDSTDVDTVRADHFHMLFDAIVVHAASPGCFGPTVRP